MSKESLLPVSPSFNSAELLLKKKAALHRRRDSSSPYPNRYPLQNREAEAPLWNQEKLAEALQVVEEDYFAPIDPLAGYARITPIDQPYGQPIPPDLTTVLHIIAFQDMNRMKDIPPTLLFPNETRDASLKKHWDISENGRLYPLISAQTIWVFPSHPSLSFERLQELVSPEDGWVELFVGSYSGCINRNSL